MLKRAIFLHGLNTYGDDDLHIGPVRLGPMHAPWEKALRQFGWDVVAPGAFGSHDPAAQAEKAVRTLEEMGWLRGGPLFAVGHSTGGLTARALARLIGPKLKALVTVGTPHHGTPAADFARTLDDRLPALAKVLRAAGYDTRKRTAIFELFTPRAAARFNREHPLPEATVCAHALCESQEGDVSWPLLPLYGNLHAAPDAKDRSDGFIHSASQNFGHRIGTYRLDHFENLGFFIKARASRRARAKAEFAKLVGDTCRFFEDLVSD